VFYTIYKVTNKINGKIYIGKHQTKNLNDGYMGSGKLITLSIENYGIENFDKEILFIFETETEMNAKEAELVTETFVKENTNYNLCPGGHGGFGYLNDGSDEHLIRASAAAKKGGKSSSESTKRKYGVDSIRSLPSIKEKSLETKRKKYGGNGFELDNNRNRAKESFEEKYGVENPSQHPAIKEKIKETFKKNKHNQGIKNSQYGTMWVTNGYENKKIKKEDVIPEGWRNGRVNARGNKK
jgi:hypothetical protein